MAEIYKYRKIIGQYTTFCLVEPDYNLLERDDPAMEGVRITELCTLDDWTHVSVPDAISLPEQPEVIADTLTPVDVSEQPELKAAIIEASPNCRSIRGRVVDKIRERYSINDEESFHVGEQHHDVHKPPVLDLSLDETSQYGSLHGIEKLAHIQF